MVIGRTVGVLLAVDPVPSKIYGVRAKAKNCSNVFSPGYGLQRGKSTSYEQADKQKHTVLTVCFCLPFATYTNAFAIALVNARFGFGDVGRRFR